MLALFLSCGGRFRSASPAQPAKHGRHRGPPLDTTAAPRSPAVHPLPRPRSPRRVFARPKCNSRAKMCHYCARYVDVTPCVGMCGRFLCLPVPEWTDPRHLRRSEEGPPTPEEICEHCQMTESGQAMIRENEETLIAEQQWELKWNNMRSGGQPTGSRS